MSENLRCTNNYPVIGRDGLDKGAWWCPACSILVEGADPVLCDSCGGDMTIAPMSARSTRSTS